MTIEGLKRLDCIVYECVSGSRAYGLDTPESDWDIRGVFVLPKEQFYGLDYVPQVSNESNDIVYFELGRFVELLSVNNPNILELLATPEECVRIKHPLMDHFPPERVLSKLCKDSFGKFAFSQIKKASGLNKKIMNPMDKERKSVLEFCFVSHEHGSMPLPQWLDLRQWNQQDCGLVKIPNMKNVFGLYHGTGNGYQGIVESPSSNEVLLSSIPKGEQQLGILYFKQDGYSSYCREHREYWSWVKKRNETRYQSTLDHGKNYDAKNMMHTFRLLEMAIEIGRSGELNVKRVDRDFLLDIKAGKFEYDELMKMADEKKEEMEEAFEYSSLPERPDTAGLKKSLVFIRSQYYSTRQ